MKPPMTRAYDEEAMKPLGPRLEPPRPWWVKRVVLAVFTATIRLTLGTLKWLFGW
jgi:hypothetical protein